jgi:predicted nucleotidyltransferase component of viral defense system
MKDRALSIARDEKTELRKKNVLREYLRHVILRELFDLEVLEKLVFHGGTALRILHGLERFSEDLDFYSRYPDDEIELASSLDQLEKRLYRQGYDISFSPLSEGAVQSFFFEIRRTPLRAEPITSRK